MTYVAAESQIPTEGLRERLKDIFYLSPRFRRQVLRALIGVAFFVAFVGILTALFGVIVLRYAVEGAATGSYIIVAAIGLTVLYGIRGFANFAYGDIVTLGAYVALLVGLGGIYFIFSALIAFVVIAIVGVLLEVIIFSRLEGRGPVPPIVASVGLALIIQNGIRVIATTRPYTYPVPATQDIPIVPELGIHPIRHIATLGVGLLFVVSSHLLLKYTTLGKAMRATADNLELAKATGIDTKRVTYAAWAVSCAFASAAGILIGLSAAVTPVMGFDQLLLIFAAVIVGGIGSPYGAMLGGLLVGLSQEMSIPLLLWLGRPDVIGLQNASAYKVAIPFIILFIVLILRPWGISGRRPTFARRSFFLERVRVVLGQHLPDSGAIRLFSEDVWRRRDTLMERVGIVPEDADTPPDMRVEDLVRFWSWLYSRWNGAMFNERMRRFAIAPRTRFVSHQ